MPYARRTRINHLTSRQLQHLSHLQQQRIPTSVASPPHLTYPRPQTCIVPPPSALNPNAREFRTTVQEASEAPARDPVTVMGDPDDARPMHSPAGSGNSIDCTNASTRATNVKVVQGHEETRSNRPIVATGVVAADAQRPGSRRSDSQTEFQIVQRGIQGNLVLLSNESPDAQPIELLSASTLRQRGLTEDELDDEAGEQMREEDEWELITYDDDEEDPTLNKVRPHALITCKA
ncbi:uncharacterized protein JCM15063_006356 [Sporobolomyces koalae]|uniref:uncharacterized protein n=1 Tax=Sporobolomyces koalae TaxID=500713 RepID=UPI00316BBF9D